MRYIDVQTIT